MSLNWERGKDWPQDLQRTTACVQSLDGYTPPPQDGQSGVLSVVLEEKKNMWLSLARNGLGDRTAASPGMAAESCF